MFFNSKNRCLSKLSLSFTFWFSDRSGKISWSEHVASADFCCLFLLKEGRAGPGAAGNNQLFWARVLHQLTFVVFFAAGRRSRPGCCREQSAELSTWHQLTFVFCCRKAEQARVLQGEVVQLYTLWDNAHHQMAGGLSHTQVKRKACSASTHRATYRPIRKFKLLFLLGRTRCASSPPSKRNSSTCATYCARTPPVWRSGGASDEKAATKPVLPPRRGTAGSATATSCCTSRTCPAGRRPSTGSGPWPNSWRRTCRPIQRLFREALVLCLALAIQSRIRIRIFLGPLDPDTDPLVRGTDPAPAPFF